MLTMAYKYVWGTIGVCDCGFELPAEFCVVVRDKR